LIAGTGGDSGKTLVTLGLAAAWRREGVVVAPFKKGPDYIDSAWLTLAAGRKARNLDLWMMTADAVLRSFTSYAVSTGVNLIEGNRGLYDGVDVHRTNSTATLAKLLASPVVLVVPVVKVTRTAAAFVLGMKQFDPAVNIAAVIINRVGTERQSMVVKRAIIEETGLPVLGIIRKLRSDLLPGRHLGLVTPQEHTRAAESVAFAAGLARDNIDLDRLWEIAHRTSPMESPGRMEHRKTGTRKGLRIGYFKGSAFTFYYPENVESLMGLGADLVAVDPLECRDLPDVDALYIGGGFPETHAVKLTRNDAFLRSVREAAVGGLPIWAECGGLIFLARSMLWRGDDYPMAGILPVDVEFSAKPCGHGYQSVEVDADNPFVERGKILRGHEFHYSRVRSGFDLPTAFKVLRGVGLGGGRDGLVRGNVLASYLHLHSLGTPEWALGLVGAAQKYREMKRRLDDGDNKQL